MGALFVLVFFTVLALATGGWSFGMAAIVFLVYLLAREIRSANVFDHGDHAPVTPPGRQGS
jgi:hypothetical protein